MIERPSPSPLEGGEQQLRTSLVSPFGVIGGAELWLLRLLDATDALLPRALLLRDGALRHELTSRGVPVDVVDVGRRGRDVAGSWTKLRALLKSQRPDVVVANGVKAQAAVGPVPRSLHVPSIWVKHDHSFDRWLTPVLARVATKVIVTTEDLVGPTRRRDVVVIHPPRPGEAPLPREEAAARLSALAGCRAPLWLLMLSRLTPYKGIDTAIRAVAVEPTGQWHLMVMGDADPAEPDERARLVDVASRLGVRERVHLVGHVPSASRLLPGGDALAVLTRPGGPRTPGREGFGMAAMEAALAGLPVIAPDDGGPVARRCAQGAGMLIDPTDPGSVADALARLTPEVRASLGGSARQQAEATYTSAEDAAERFVRVLRDAVGQEQPQQLGTVRRP